MGAWIEIGIFDNEKKNQKSLLSWERGLKSVSLAPSNFDTIVAPLVGAWIEIVKRCTTARQRQVAPLVGAWIEINVGGHTSGVGCGSLLSWERGLK